MKTHPWEKIGRILAPARDTPFLTTHAGPSFALPERDSSRCLVYVTGRDAQNRSTIMRGAIDLERPEKGVVMEREPVFTHGELGAFDENGVAYPCIVRSTEGLSLYYVGWMQTVRTPFQNHLGLARSTDGGRRFVRVSRAPILERTDDDPFCIGSAFVMLNEGRWRMWYTSWLRWGKSPNEPKHYYHIKYAESEDGVSFRREGRVCIDFSHSDEYAIAKPSVLKVGQSYHMWYVHRGAQYRIGYARSADGYTWERQDDRVGIGVSEKGWDSRSICYPHVFQWREGLYMLYCGNEYGRGGLGLARMELAAL